MISETFADMMHNMRHCYQFENVNMYEHGSMVHESFKQLIAQLEGGEQTVDLPP
jgi:hypothetical protein